MSANRESELLTDLSDAELAALADGKLAPSAQRQLDELLERNSAGLLEEQEQAELDRLLAQADQLTILKTRARLTLREQAEATGT